MDAIFVTNILVALRFARLDVALMEVWAVQIVAVSRRFYTHKEI
jgi:hypothetical protein